MIGEAMELHYSKIYIGEAGETLPDRVSGCLFELVALTLTEWNAQSCHFSAIVL